MANPKPSNSFRNVSVLARGPILEAIMRRAEERSISLNKAATSLIEDALAGTAQPSAAPASTLINLEAVSTDDLIDELVGRLSMIDELDSAIARAELAEAKLNAITNVLVPEARA